MRRDNFAADNIIIEQKRKTMSTPIERFAGLHQSSDLFVLPNVWNSRSALAFQENGFSAVATSSAAIADSLGYPDGEGMPFAEYLSVIRRILASIRIPLSVDIEMGYGDTNEEIYRNILQLVDLGVVGINIEDSTTRDAGAVDEGGGQPVARLLKPLKSFANTIEYIKGKLAAVRAELFINVRCDTYLLNVANKEKETRERTMVYEASGADGIFLPCICEEADISAAVNNTELPVNVMCVPGLPNLDVLQRLGVKRVSMGPFLYTRLYELAGQLSKAVMTGRSFAPLFAEVWRPVQQFAG
jgi:2-methylisocitrate lyase-like PEP mutase family enzyme